LEEELQCICGWPIRGAHDLRRAGVEAGKTILRCGNNLCLLEELCRVSYEGGRYMVGFSPMFSDWNLIMMGRDRLERKLERLGRMIVETFGGGEKKFFKVMTRWK